MRSIPELLAEADVHQRDVRRVTFDQFASFTGGARRADDLEALAAEQQLESLPQGLMILDEYERKRHEGLQLCGNSAR